MQMLPCGWINPEAVLMLGPGAVINPAILIREVAAVEEETGIDIQGRLLIDYRATILDESHVLSEGHTEGEIHKRIGSTGEGVGAARVAKIMRNSNLCQIANELRGSLPGKVINTVDLLDSISPRKILLEGTQGYGLSLHLGPWPYVTSHMCTAPQLAADAGLPRIDTCYMVIRTFPIRVAGNSGPLPNEISWEELSKRIGRDVIETTTVTRKVRRVAEFDKDMVREAARVNGATFMVINFVDYLHPEMEHVTRMENIPDEVHSWLHGVAAYVDIPIVWIGTGFSESRGWSHVEVWGGIE
jgi:adenylosuccinate synthase